ncbi:SDR family NAD(P)-dependent oxidoreductase [Phaeobacter italicus]|uniref:SDR family NAD(P)-dependent oxidoreductase n=1 Tax=Phaeobacter italicus TaxID=481446 RepID=UPI003515C011
MTEVDANWTVITGSTGGIGSEIAKIHAARGNSLILINRSQTRSEAQRSELLSAYPDLNVELIIADLMNTDEVTTAIHKINALPGRVDALYNNSGVLTSEKVLSAQGYESQFAVNVLAPYQLTLGLKDKMARQSGESAGMVVLFSSSAINSQKTLNLNELANPGTVGGLMSTYAQTKLAVTALAPALSDGLSANNILIRAVDPGATKTAMTTTGNSGMPKLLQWLAPLLFRPADKQAAKVVDAADPAAFGGRTGLYVANRKEKRLPKPAADPANQKQLIEMLGAALKTS